jgi:hypothetical protein
MRMRTEIKRKQKRFGKLQQLYFILKRNTEDYMKKKYKEFKGKKMRSSKNIGIKKELHEEGEKRMKYVEKQKGNKNLIVISSPEPISYF